MATPYSQTAEGKAKTSAIQSAIRAAQKQGQSGFIMTNDAAGNQTVTSGGSRGKASSRNIVYTDQTEQVAITNKSGTNVYAVTDTGKPVGSLGQLTTADDKPVTSGKQAADYFREQAPAAQATDIYSQPKAEPTPQQPIKEETKPGFIESFVNKLFPTKTTDVGGGVLVTQQQATLGGLLYLAASESPGGKGVSIGGKVIKAVKASKGTKFIGGAVSEGKKIIQETIQAVKTFRKAPVTQIKQSVKQAGTTVKETIKAVPTIVKKAGSTAKKIVTTNPITTIKSGVSGGVKLVKGGAGAVKKTYSDFSRLSSTAKGAKTARVVKDTVVLGGKSYLVGDLGSKGILKAGDVVAEKTGDEYYRSQAPNFKKIYPDTQELRRQAIPETSGFRNLIDPYEIIPFIQPRPEEYTSAVLKGLENQPGTDAQKLAAFKRYETTKGVAEIPALIFSEATSEGFGKGAFIKNLGKFGSIQTKKFGAKVVSLGLKIYPPLTIAESQTQLNILSSTRGINFSKNQRVGYGILAGTVGTVVGTGQSALSIKPGAKLFGVKGEKIFGTVGAALDFPYESIGDATYAGAEKAFFKITGKTSPAVFIKPGRVVTSFSTAADTKSTSVNQQTGGVKDTPKPSIFTPTKSNQVKQPSGGFKVIQGKVRTPSTTLSSGGSSTTTAFTSTTTPAQAKPSTLFNFGTTAETPTTTKAPTDTTLKTLIDVPTTTRTATSISVTTLGYPRPALIPPIIPGGGFGSFKFGSRRTGKLPKVYTPTAQATLFNIKAPKGKKGSGRLSGFEQRGIRGTTRKLGLSGSLFLGAKIK